MYRPGSKNSKVEALLWCFATAKPVMNPEPILCPSLVVAPITWDLDSNITRVMRRRRRSQDCPLGQMYMPRSLRVWVIEWAHCLPATGHPGTNSFVIM